jgi:hypothetical protein
MYINGFTRESVMKQIKARNLGYPSYSEDGDQCLYRASDGNQCLVGCFMPDDLYEGRFEGEPAEVIYDIMPDKMPIVRTMLRKLQIFHDDHAYEKSADGGVFFEKIEHKLIDLEKQWEEEND